MLKKGPDEVLNNYREIQERYKERHKNNLLEKREEAVNSNLAFINHN